MKKTSQKKSQHASMYKTTAASLTGARIVLNTGQGQLHKPGFKQQVKPITGSLRRAEARGPK